MTQYDLEIWWFLRSNTCLHHTNMFNKVNPPYTNRATTMPQSTHKIQFRWLTGLECYCSPICLIKLTYLKCRATRNQCPHPTHKIQFKWLIRLEWLLRELRLHRIECADGSFFSFGWGLSKDWAWPEWAPSEHWRTWGKGTTYIWLGITKLNDINFEWEKGEWRHKLEDQAEPRSQAVEAKTGRQEAKDCEVVKWTRSSWKKIQQ